MIDYTHTADGLKVARVSMLSLATMLVLETALPAHFATIAEATRRQFRASAPGLRAWMVWKRCPEALRSCQAHAEAVKDYVVQHCAELNQHRVFLHGTPNPDASWTRRGPGCATWLRITWRSNPLSLEQIDSFDALGRSAGARSRLQRGGAAAGQQR